MATKKTLSFVSKGKPSALKNMTADGTVVDHGLIGDLKYDLYSRGVIHIKDKKGLCFKKDPDNFEEALEDIDFATMSEEEEALIPGSGDNDDLILAIKDGEIVLSLRKKEFKLIRKLRDLISKGKQNKSKK